MAEKLYSQLSFHFVKPGRLTEFLLRRYSSSPCCCLWTSSQKFNFPWQSTNEILFLDIEKVVIVRLGRIFETLSQCHSRRQGITEHEKRVHSGKKWWRLRFFQFPPETNGSPDLPSETFGKTLWRAACFWFSQCNFRYCFDPVLFFAYLNNEQDTEPLVIKKVIHWITFNLVRRKTQSSLPTSELRSQSESRFCICFE